VPDGSLLGSHVLTTASGACTLFAAHARKVSGTQIPLNYRKFAGHFKGAIQSDIREFESCRPSQQIAFAAAT
jgi:hypothetical protein